MWINFTGLHFRRNDNDGDPNRTDNWVEVTDLDGLPVRQVSLDGRPVEGPALTPAADAVANPQVIGTEAGFLYVYNGTTWDRARSGGAADGNAAIANTGVQKVQLHQWSSTGNLNPVIPPSQTGDGTSGIDNLATMIYGYNGSGFDRLRTRGTGILQVEQAFSYAHIAAGQATTVVKASAGTLHSITMNSAATATNVTTVYDNASTSGTVIAIPNAVAATVPTTLIFDVAFANGCTIITTTANGGDMTVSYR